MKTILCATDYSKNSIAALKYAHTMSLKMKTKLLVVHVFNYPTILDDLSLKEEDPFADIEGDVFKKQNTKLISFCKKNLNDDLENLNIEIEAIENKSVVKGILLKANEVEAFIIVTGMKHNSALKGFILGNTTKQLLKKSPCPVLTIPSDTGQTQIETIVYATDFEEEDLGAIDKLTEIAKPFNANIKIVHVSSFEKIVGERQKKDIKDTIQKYIEYDNFEIDILYSDNVFNDLKKYLGNVNADLVAMLERESKSFTSQIFHKDLVKKMESYCKIPLIIFNAKNYGIFHF